MRKSLLAAAALAVALVLGWQIAAHAATTPAGAAVIYETESYAFGGTATQIVVECPAGTYVVGGGNDNRYVNGVSVAAYPDPVQNAWVDYSNGSGTAYATCIPG